MQIINQSKERLSEQPEVIQEIKARETDWLLATKLAHCCCFFGKGSEQFVKHIIGEKSRDLRSRGIQGALSELLRKSVIQYGCGLQGLMLLHVAKICLSAGARVCTGASPRWSDYTPGFTRMQENYMWQWSYLLWFHSIYHSAWHIMDMIS